MNEAQWQQAADQHGVTHNYRPLILDLARIQLDNLKPAVAAGVVTPPGSIWDIAAGLVQQGEVREPHNRGLPHNTAPDIRWADA